MAELAAIRFAIMSLMTHCLARINNRNDPKTNQLSTRTFNVTNMAETRENKQKWFHWGHGHRFIPSHRSH